MQKTCKSEVCKRKFDKNSISDMCPACEHAYKSGESHSQRRGENSSRQSKARSSGFDNNRDLSGFTFPPPSSSGPPHHPPATLLATQQKIGLATTSSHTITTNTMTVPSNPNIDMTRLHNNLQAMSGSTTTSLPSNDTFKDMYGMLVHLCKKSDEAEKVKTDVVGNTSRIARLEAKLGGSSDDVAVPLSLAIRNLPLPGPGVDDRQLVRSVFYEINAREVDIDNDIVKVTRQGATNENLGTVMVEMRSDEARASIMKTKKVLEHHNNPGLRKLIIKNMKSRLELKIDIALGDILKKFPGGENYYVANNGHIREKSEQQRSYQNNFRGQLPPNFYTQTAQSRPLNPPYSYPPPQLPTHVPAYPTPMLTVPQPTTSMTTTLPSDPFMFGGPSSLSTPLIPVSCSRPVVIDTQSPQPPNGLINNHPHSYSLTSQSTSVTALPPSVPMSSIPVQATTAAPQSPTAIAHPAVPTTNQPDQRQHMVVSQAVQSGGPEDAAQPHPGAGQQVPGSQG